MIAHFCSDFDGKGNNRFNYIADLISQFEYDVELVTTDFSHDTKKRRGEIFDQYDYKITMLYEPGYSKNVSLKRFYSHYVMGRNLKKYFKTRKKPDIIYCAVPSLDMAEVTAEYAKKNNIRFIIDIQDLWPEAFNMVFNVPFVSDIIFYPMKKQADYIYREADVIIAVSNTYVERASRVNEMSQRNQSIFLGTELSSFDSFEQQNKFMDKPGDEIWHAYIGTLGHSYDLTYVIDALKILQDKGIGNIKFVVMGDGPLKKGFEKYAKERQIYAEFTGRLGYGKMVGILTACDIAVNPIIQG